jgi:plasmid stabilization system protein ParE
MKVVVRRAAALQVASIHDHIAGTNPRAARALAERIAATGFGEIGRPGRIRGTREIVEHPYVIVDRFDPIRNEIVVLSVIHGARRR